MGIRLSQTLAELQIKTIQTEEKANHRALNINAMKLDYRSSILNLLSSTSRTGCLRRMNQLELAPGLC
jgi:hypothetical protein